MQKENTNLVFIETVSNYMPVLLFVIILLSSFAVGNLYQNFTHKPQQQSTTTQVNPSPTSKSSKETQPEVNQDDGVIPNNVKGISNTKNVQPIPTPTPIQNSQNTINRVINNALPVVNNLVPRLSQTSIISPTHLPTSTPPTPSPTAAPTPTPTPPVVQEVENPRISFEIYWIKLSGVGYVPEYRYYTSVCLGNLDVVWGHFYIIDPNGQEWNTGNHDYRQKPCQNLSANGSLEGKPLGEYTFKAVFDEMGVTKSVKATVGQPPL